jgi:hypothetical protein
MPRPTLHKRSAINVTRSGIRLPGLDELRASHTSMSEDEMLMVSANEENGMVTAGL